MRRAGLSFLFLIGTLALTTPPAWCDYDSFELPPGVEQTRIPRRLRPTTVIKPGANQEDLIQIEHLRLQIEHLYKINDFAGAEPLYRAYVALLEKVVPDDARVATALQNYADLLHQLHRDADAAAALGKAQAILSRMEEDVHPFGLKQYRLGMKHDEFTHLPAPGIDQKVRSVCSCDQGQTLEILSGPDKIASVVQCGFWLSTKGEPDQPYKMTVADIECYPDFKFIKDEDDLRLFEISLTFFRSYFDSMKEALIARYGKPKEVKTSNMQTEMGNNFRVEDLIWDNGISKIRLTNIDGTDLTRAKLRYIHKQLSLIYAKRISDAQSVPLKRAEEDL